MIVRFYCKLYEGMFECLSKLKLHIAGECLISSWTRLSIPAYALGRVVYSVGSSFSVWLVIVAEWLLFLKESGPISIVTDVFASLIEHIFIFFHILVDTGTSTISSVSILSSRHLFCH